ncbi:MAG: c-type cytochrome [Bacteroidetes bacterium]|nr:c-type cytochrome [Bacteroidota bacterium]
MKRTNHIFRQIVLGTTMIASPFTALFAEEEKAIETVHTIAGIPSAYFYSIFGILLLIVISVILLVVSINKQIAPIIREINEKKGIKKRSWFEKLNETKSFDSESEASIDMGHDYDGIRELDNPTPPWWKWGFRLSMVFAVVYMWVYFVGKNAPLQLEELAIANAKAEKAKAEYLAKSGNQVDESNIPEITDKTQLAEGQSMFIQSCAACHLEDGGGMIGPNLTDNYWLHGNKLNDIFKTIKYGVPGTGMVAWKNNFSDKQIVEISNFVKSLHGTTPKTPKEHEGTLIND